MEIIHEALILNNSNVLIRLFTAKAVIRSCRWDSGHAKKFGVTKVLTGPVLRALLVPITRVGTVAYFFIKSWFIFTEHTVCFFIAVISVTITVLFASLVTECYGTIIVAESRITKSTLTFKVSGAFYPFSTSSRDCVAIRTQRVSAVAIHFTEFAAPGWVKLSVSADGNEPEYEDNSCYKSK